MYDHTSYSKRTDQTGKVANPARCQLNRKTDFSMPALASQNLVSRDGFGRLSITVGLSPTLYC